MAQTVTTQLRGMADSSACNPSCFLLDKLPPELRNEIYELVYPSKPVASTAVQLFEARPPNDESLLLTCRQIGSEAGSYYKESYRNYWQGSSFAIDIPHQDLASTKVAAISDMRLALASLKASDLDHVTKLDITGLSLGRAYAYDSSYKYSLVRSMGLWFCEVFDPSTPKAGPVFKEYGPGLQLQDHDTLTWSDAFWSQDKEVAEKMVSENLEPVVQHLQVVGMLWLLTDELHGHGRSAVPIRELPKVLGAAY